MKKNNKAFNIIELMVVVAIISIIAILTANINFNKNIDNEKRDKFVNKIISIIDTEVMNSSIGKGVYSGSVVMNPTNITILINTGSIISKYFNSGAQIGTGELFQNPFYGDKFYSIERLEYESNTGSTGSIVSLKIELLDSGITKFYSGGTELTNAVKINIPAGYKKNYKNIIFDKRTKIINVK